MTTTPEHDELDEDVDVELSWPLEDVFEGLSDSSGFLFFPFGSSGSL